MIRVVVGGGAIGTNNAWHIADHGLGEIILIERDRLGSGTTCHSVDNITWKPSSNHDASALYVFDTIARLESSFSPRPVPARPGVREPPSGS